MSTIDLYQVLKKIPDVTDEQTKQAADATGQSVRLEKIDAAIAGIKTDITEVSRVNYFVRYVLPQIEITLPGIVTPHHSKFHF